MPSGKPLPESMLIQIDNAICVIRPQLATDMKGGVFSDSHGDIDDNVEVFLSVDLEILLVIMGNYSSRLKSRILILF